MPIHIDTLTTEDPNRILNLLLKKTLNNSDDVISSEGKRILHIAKHLNDSVSGERIGKSVVTVIINEQKTYDLIDVDITVNGGDKTELRFLKRLSGSSDANEYYDVEAISGGQHLQVETVNRNRVSRDDLTGTVLDIRVCAFPFRLKVFDSIDALNDFFGFGKKNDGETGQRIGGLSAVFAAPGSLSQIPDAGTFSILVGTVKSVKDVAVDLGEIKLPLTVAWMDSALGLLPVAMNRDLFDIDELVPGKVVYMYANVKADFAPEQ